jgi:hypothetical protein
MPNAKPITIGLAVLALAGCGDKNRQNNADANLAIDEGMPSGQVPANAEIETLPADESSVTSSNELQHGIDAPDENESAGNAE